MDSRLHLMINCDVSINYDKTEMFNQYRPKEYSFEDFNKINKTTLRQLSCYRCKYFGLDMERWHLVTPKKFQSCNIEKAKIISRILMKNFCENFLMVMASPRFKKKGEVFSKNYFRILFQNIAKKLGLLCFGIAPLIYLSQLICEIESFKMM